jgi:hypothetical protein
VSDKDKEIVQVEKGEDTLFKLRGMDFTMQRARIEPGLPFDQWASGVYMIDTVQRGAPWWLGDMLLYGEQEYGESYAQVMEHTEMSYSTLTTYKSVAKAFPPHERRQGVDWSKHEACAALMRLAPDVAGKLLDGVQKDGMPLREVKWHAREQIAMLDKEDADNGWKIPQTTATPVADIKNLLTTIPRGDWSTRAKVIARPDASWLDGLLEIVLEVARSEGMFRLELARNKAKEWAEEHGFDLEDYDEEEG